MFRLTARGLMERPKLEPLALAKPDPSAARVGRRSIFVDAKNGMADADIYDFERLVPGNVVPGPAVIHTPITTIVLQAAQRGTMDGYRNILVDFEQLGCRTGDHSDGPDHLLHHSPSALPRGRGSGDHAQARVRQRHHQRRARPDGLALSSRRLAADGRRRLSPSPDQRSRGVQGDHSAVRRGRSTKAISFCSTIPIPQRCTRPTSISSRRSITRASLWHGALASFTCSTSAR